MVTVSRFSSPKRIEIARKICMNNNLYVEGWSFRNWLENYTIDHIYILALDYRPIGCLIILNNSEVFHENFGVYVNPNFRKKGFGRKMVERAMTDLKEKKFIYSEGILGSETFFKKTVDKFRR